MVKRKVFVKRKREIEETFIFMFLLVLFVAGFFVLKNYTGFVTFEDASQSNFSKYATPSISNLLQEYRISDKQFKEIEISNRKVFFYQRCNLLYDV